MPALTPHEQFLIEVGREIGKPRCEKCACELNGEAAHIEAVDEIWCHSCADNAAEAAYERHCEAYHDGGATQFRSLLDQQIEAQKLK